MKFYHLLAMVPAAFVILSSCSTTTKITSQFNDSETSPSHSGNLTERLVQSERHTLEGLAYYVTHDDTHLFIMVDFISARYYRLAREFGFTLYIDGKDDFNRSFGITYPTGLFYELGDYPGARKGFLEEPNWENFPENAAAMESARNNMGERALLIQRRSRRDDMRAAPVPVTQLHAQNLRLEMDTDEQRGRIAFAIPLEVRSTSQFSPEIGLGEEIDVGFEIDPIRLFDMDSATAVPMITSESASGRARTERGTDNEQQERMQLIQRRIGERFSHWITVSLEDPE